MESAAAPTALPQSRTTLYLGLAGAVLCYLAHPPVGWSLLAWIGPTPWVLLARLHQLPGKRPYRTLWLAGFVYWMLTIQWIRLPHPANHIAWPLISIYLGAYLPLFVGLTRVAHHRLRVPVWIAAPVVWTGFELVRAHILTGFLMASLAHTQVGFPAVIQLASIAGEYGVTFLIVLVAAGVAEASPIEWVEGRHVASKRSGGAARRLAVGVAGSASLLLIVALVGAAWMAVHSSDPAATMRVAIVQSDMLSDWKGDEERDRDVMQQQIKLSRQAVKQAGDDSPDVIIWPETMFRQPLCMLDKSFSAGVRITDPKCLIGTQQLRELAREFNAAMIVGIDRVNFLPVNDPAPGTDQTYERFNSSVLVTPDGVVQGTYDKMHLLPLGEYVPLVEWLPFLKNLTPITGLADPGARPTAFIHHDVVYAVNICYETVLPHLIRRHVVELTAQGHQPDVLVNLTNDAWYWGSSELDMHLASGVFRAVEMRMPLVIAANRGLSAHIDRLGQIVQVSQRDQAEVLLADVALGKSHDYQTLPTFYAYYGDWLPAICLVCCVILAVVGWRNKKSRRLRLSGLAAKRLSS